MKTKEFIKRIKELGFECVKFDNWFYLRDLKFNDNFLAEICINESFKVDTGSYEFGMLDQTRKIRLFDLIIEYARTPIEDREEEKKFYLRHRWMGNSWWKYLNQLDDGSYFIREGDLVPSLKNTFSLKEIEEIKKKFNTELKDFELVEVEK